MNAEEESKQLREQVARNLQGRECDPGIAAELILLQVARFRHIHATLFDDSCIQLSSNGAMLCEVIVDAAKIKLRAMCARFARICAEQNHDCNPYGDETMFEYEGTHYNFVFENTPDNQEFDLRVCEAPPEA